MSLPLIEIAAVIFNLAYVILAWYQKKICWLFGGIGSLLSVYYFQHEDIRLYSEAGLYMFYVVMAVYGWWAWSRPDGSPIHEVSRKSHILLIGGGVLGALLLSQITGAFTDADKPLADALSTVFGVIATFMTIRKILSNWIYWVVIDLFTVGLYISKGSNLYAAQMLLFAILAVYGYRQWKKDYKELTSA